MINIISLKNIRLYAYHGCLLEEAQIGSEYRVDVTIQANFQTSIDTDELSDTIDYVHINRIVKEQMAIRSKLLENLAGRIIKQIKSDFQQVERVEVEVAKINPPLGGDVEAVSIKIID